MSKPNGAGSGTPDESSQASLLGPNMSNPNEFFSDLDGSKKPKTGTRVEGDEADHEQEQQGSLADQKPIGFIPKKEGEEGGDEGAEGEEKGKEKKTPRWSSLEEAEQSQREADKKIATQSETMKRLERELDTLKNLAVDASAAERKIEELKRIESRLKPYLGMDKAVTSIDETLKNIKVPEEMMTGVDDAGNKIATEQDKMLVFIADKKNLVKLVSDLSQATVQSEQQQKTETAKTVDATLIKLCMVYNKAEGEEEGKALTPAELQELAKVMGPERFAKVFDPSTSDESRTLILENSLLMYMNLKGKGKADGEGEEDLDKKRRMASLPRSKSDPKPPQAQLNPNQKKVYDMLSGMAEQARSSRVVLPCDQKKIQGE